MGAPEDKEVFILKLGDRIEKIMEYIIEDDRLFRILDSGSKEQLGWIIDNGRGDGLAVNIAPIKEKWIEECEKYGIPSHKENEPIPFWNNEEDAKRAFEEFYKEIGND